MIDILNLSVQFTGNYLFEDVNLKILPNDKIALVGSNGSGKSTLLKILSSQQESEDGQIQYKKGIKIGYLPQEIISLSNNTVFNEVRDSLTDLTLIEQEEQQLHNELDSGNTTEEKKQLIIDKLGKLNYKKEEIGYYEIDSQIKKVLTGLGFTEQDFGRNTSELSGGWQMRIELAKILIQHNDLILLDEPTNHLDIDSLRWLVSFLKSFKGAIILVSHDRYFVNNICNKTLEIFNKKVTFFKGSFNHYLDFKTERAELLKAQYLDQQKQIKQTKQFIERFRYKATKAKQVQSRIKQLEKLDRIELIDNENKINFKFNEASRSGDVPLLIENVYKSYDELSVLEDINLQIVRGDKIALVGPNGAGKTTLAKLLSNRLQPTKGKISKGHNTIVSFYAQDIVDNLTLENDLLEELLLSDAESTIPKLRSLLGAFLFNGDDVFKKIKVLSGGEKSRVALAKVLLNKANTIILDEPTNHLDFESKKILQDALKNFNGTLVIVSHDIDFLKPIITKVVEVRNKGIKEYYGNIEYYLSKREEEKNSFEEHTNYTAKEEEKLTRKEQKRLEAERRQKEYKATNKLKKQIEAIEELISELEEQKQKLENDFTKEEIYSNPERAKQNKLDYEKTKVQLDNSYHEWTELNEELEKITNELK
jgi:ATP-binding cassette subfamily F protein 3